MENNETKTKRYLLQVYTCMDQMICWDVLNVPDCDGTMADDMKAVSSAFMRLALIDDGAFCDLYCAPEDRNDDGLFVCRIRL